MAISVPIVADYDSSGVDKAQASFGELSRTVGKAFSEVRKAAKQSLGDLESGLEDSRTAGQKLAAQLSAAASKMNADLARTTETADRLADALGPEMASKLGRGGVNRLVSDLQRAGLTLEDIDASVTELADSLRMLDAQDTSKLNGELAQTQARMTMVANEADRSRGVMANFVGNAVQEVPGLSHAFGPLNVAIGQFAEYATEGGIAMRGLLTTLGPIAAITGGMAILGAVFGDSGKRAQELEQAARDVGSALAEQATAAQESKVLTSDLSAALLEAADSDGVLAQALLTLGVNLSDADDAILANKTNTEAWAQSQLRQADVTDKQREALAKGIAAGESYNEVIYRANQTEPMTDAQLNSARAYVKALIAVRDAAKDALLDSTYKQGITDLVLQYGDAGQAAYEFAAAQTGLTINSKDLGPLWAALSAQLPYITAGFYDGSLSARELGNMFGFLGLNAQDAATNIQQATPEVDQLSVLFGNAAIAAGDAADETRRWSAELERIKGVLDLEDAVDRVDDSLRDLQDAQQAAADAAKKGGKEYEDALERVSDQLRDTKREVIAYGTEILGLPDEMTTDIVAMLDTESAEYVRQYLNDLAKRREVVYVPGVSGLGKARGGSVNAGQPYVVGERGPELFVPQGAGQIVPNHRLAPAASSSATAPVYNITVQGAIDPVATAYQIRRILNDDQARQASTSLVGV